MTDDRQGVWARPPRGARGPSPEHHRDDVAAAAIRLADERGLAAVSMRAVAAELGTTASSLYRYVASRDELLDLMVDAAMAGFAPPELRDGWLDSLVRLAEQTRRLYLTRPWLMDVRQARSVPGPHTLAWFDHCLHALAELDLPAVSKMEAIGVLNGVVMNFARAAAAPSTMDFSALDPRRHSQLVAALSDAAAGQTQPRPDLFERTVRALLTGLLG